jgi:hypothetical protein
MSDPELTNNSIRTLEPIYPAENFVTAPVLGIQSYKQLTRTVPATPPGETIWSGWNNYDVRYVLV